MATEPENTERPLNLCQPPRATEERETGEGNAGAEIKL